MKKIVLASTLSLLSATVFADDKTHGFYVGAGLGGAVAHHTSTGSFTALAPATSQNFKPDLNKISGALSLLIGYAWKIQCWHLGLELDYVFDNLNTKFYQEINNPLDNNPYLTLKSTGAIGAAFKVGYHWNKILGFISLGIENRRFKLSSNLGADSINDIGNINTINAKYTKNAFVPGLGVQTHLTPNLSATLEYKMALYSKINNSLTSAGNGGGTTKIQINPRVSTLLLSFRYHF